MGGLIGLPEGLPKGLIKPLAEGPRMHRDRDGDPDQNPPKPPQGGADGSRRDLEERAARARGGSNRDRDRSALRQLEVEDRASWIPEGWEESEKASEVWARIMDPERGSLREIPASTRAMWLEPLRVLGEVNNGIVLACPPQITTWVRRRYGPLIGKAIRAASDYRGAYIGDRPRKSWSRDPIV